MQEFGTTLKVGEAKSGVHKVAFEEKMKYKMSEFGGHEGECKFKSSGDLDYKLEMNFPKVSIYDFLMPIFIFQT